MELQDLRHESGAYIIEMRVKGSKNEKIEFRLNEPIRIVMIDTHILVQSMIRDDVSIEVKALNEQNQNVIERLIATDLPRLASVISFEDNILTIAIKTFVEQRIMDYAIRVSDSFYSKLRKSVQLSNVVKPYSEIVNSNLYYINDISYCVVGVHIHIKSSQGFNHFIVAGKDYYIYVKKLKDDNEKTYYEAERISAQINKEDYKFFLARGKIRFTEMNELIREETLVVMEQSEEDSYIKIWDKYGEVERENVMNQATLLGSIRSISYEYEPGGKIRFDFSPEAGEKLIAFQQKFKKGDLLTISPINPFVHQIGVQEFEEFLKKNRDFLINLYLAEDISANENCMIFWGDDEITQKLRLLDEAYIFMSITGDMKRLRRRMEARRKIQTATCPMPQLGALLEGKSVSKPKSKKYEALSELVLKEVFKTNPPTPKQKQAIEIALNTPDIALIQGPPGTGKTTVITGILKRLNEESNSSEGIFGKNLVTAFQHDAVQNAIDRIEILGLPAIKFGRKQGENTDDTSEINAAIENWINEKCTILQNKHTNFLNKKYITEFNNIFVNYLYSANSIEQTLQLLEDTRELLLLELSQELLEDLNKQIRALKYKVHADEDIELKSLIRAIRRIPINEIAYEDNGDMILREASYKLCRLEDERFAGFIKSLDSIRQQKDKNFLELKQLRKELLVMLLPKDKIFTTKSKKEEITSLMTNISEFLLDQVARGEAGEEFVILEYMQALEENPLAVKNAILNYTAVNGATNQQVMRKEISDLKGGNIIYDNVLVDEAARSNPLDLFIPMSIAKDRIILVGDHRQLPHIIDDQIVNIMENDEINASHNIKKEIENKLKESMFEQLFSKLKNLERADGIKRTITLDKQYRMHPTLGNFVNENFYKKYDESESVESPRAAEQFSHSLPDLENKACVWLDVPLSEGQEKSGQSKSRRIEAKKLAQHIKELLESEEGKKMNFGIITFYKEQVNAINDELYKVGVLVKDEENNYEVSPQYRFNEISKVEKIRVGTVDAFQGMEFDVVYLSMVRSNTLPGKTQKERNKKYGFLMYENRLCVSMSRQKKILICVGDSTMLQSVEAEEAISPLVNYYTLCKEDVIYGKII